MASGALVGSKLDKLRFNHFLVLVRLHSYA